jgi:hypothetical protein
VEDVKDVEKIDNIQKNKTACSGYNAGEREIGSIMVIDTADITDRYY